MNAASSEADAEHDLVYGLDQARVVVGDDQAGPGQPCSRNERRNWVRNTSVWHSPTISPRTSRPPVFGDRRGDDHGLRDNPVLTRALQ